MLKVIPVVLTNNPGELKEMLGKAEEATDMVQIDIVDGIFADNKTIDPKTLEYIETNLNVDFHLMTKEPVNWVESCARGQAFRITANIEMMTSQIEFVEKVVEVGCKVGLALNLDTPVAALDETVLNDVDAILLLAIKEVGFGGKPFERSVLEKIKELDSIRKGDATPYSICVDGGVTKDVIKDIANAGADEVFIGRRLFNGDLKTNINEFEKSAL